MLTLAGTSWSFDRASVHLKEFCHVAVSDDTIERVCQEEGQGAASWMGQSQQPVKAFAKAAGQVEFSSDGVKINTTGGWREMRLSVLAKREAAEPCEPQDWDKRVLNEPTVRLACCKIGKAGHVGAQWGRLCRRMKLKEEPAVHVIADGAKWIWEQAAVRLPKHNAVWNVDVYHVSQHLHECARRMLGEGAAARAWADERLMHALQCNGPSLIEWLESEEAGSAQRDGESIAGLLSYLRENRDRMWYRDRLRDGLPIGSGLIEGACKNTIGVRLKANNARWRIRRAERIGALRCLDSSNFWEAYWSSRAA